MPVCRNSSHDLGPTGVTRGISVFFTGERVFVLFWWSYLGAGSTTGLRAMTCSGWVRRLKLSRPLLSEARIGKVTMYVEPLQIYELFWNGGNRDVGRLDSRNSLNLFLPKDAQKPCLLVGASVWLSAVLLHYHSGYGMLFDLMVEAP